jgi:RNA polymerase sigma-70 factor, ECF subfamily
MMRTATNPTSEDAFRLVVEDHRAELHAHCYRMLGSLHDAEDALQETLLRAWRGLPKFAGRSSLRTWLYRIATNACMDAIARRPKRVLPIDYGPPSAPTTENGQPLVESVWVEPYPDQVSGSRTAMPRPTPATSSGRLWSSHSSRRCSTCRPRSAPF